MLVYLAGPIDGTSREDATNWRDVARKVLLAEGINTYSPAHAFMWSKDSKDGTQLIEINKRALLMCDAVYAFVPSGTSTVGTWLEVMRAQILNKPVIMQTDLTDHIYLQQFILVDNIKDGIKRLLELREGV